MFVFEVSEQGVGTLRRQLTQRTAKQRFRLSRDLFLIFLIFSSVSGWLSRVLGPSLGWIFQVLRPAVGWGLQVLRPAVGGVLQVLRLVLNELHNVFQPEVLETDPAGQIIRELSILSFQLHLFSLETTKIKNLKRDQVDQRPNYIKRIKTSY